MKKSEMRIGYISEIGNPGERWRLNEATYTRTINSKGDRIRSKLLAYPIDYEEVENTTKDFKSNPKMMIVCEPFFIDDELRTRITRWLEWANKTDPKEYDPFLNPLLK